MRCTPLRAKRKTPRRRLAPRWTTAEWEAANVLLMARCGGYCEWCMDPLDRVERHHRQKRTVGGDRLANLVALHPRCHKYLTEHPLEAKTEGFIVVPWTADVAAAPILFPAGWVLLADDGTTTPMEDAA